MFRRSVIGAAAAVGTALCIAAMPAQPAGAQSPPVRKDTAAAVAPADTGFQTVGMQEFEARRKRGGGRYLTWAQMRGERDRSLGDILVAHFPGIRLVYGPHLDAQYLVSTRGEGVNALIANGGTSLCYLQVFVDGSFIVDGDISWINPNDVAGLELYDGTRTPPAYRRAAGECGALLVWSRTGGD